ncbi:Kelch-type_beta propeller [Hexamita inflata]|uniref:Kelch-type beta propeller n=1 Tax=Hexamita inflata TaxID=28002 RepID=A0AA86UIB7_9EUKA|nr:Kelch-type beta propeller [Hexamita inflata]
MLQKLSCLQLPEQNFQSKFIFAFFDCILIGKRDQLVKIQLSSGEITEFEQDIPEVVSYCQINHQCFIQSLEQTYLIQNGQTVAFRHILDVQQLFSCDNTLYGFKQNQLYKLQLKAPAVLTPCNTIVNITASCTLSEESGLKTFVFDGQFIYSIRIKQEKLYFERVTPFQHTQVYCAAFQHIIFIQTPDSSFLLDSRSFQLRHLSLPRIQHPFTFSNEFLINQFQAIPIQFLFMSAEPVLTVGKTRRFPQSFQNFQVQLQDVQFGQISTGPVLQSSSKLLFYEDYLNCFKTEVQVSYQQIFFDQKIQLGYGSYYTQIDDYLFVINQYNKITKITQAGTEEVDVKVPFRKRYFAACCAYEDYILVSGGIDCETYEVLDDIWAYDLINNIFTKMNLNLQLFGHTLTQIEDKMVVLGGCKSLDFQTNPDGYTFTMKSEMIEEDENYFNVAPRYGFQVINLRQRLFILGGSAGFGEKKETSVVVFDLKEKQQQVFEDIIYFYPHQKFGYYSNMISSSRQKFDYTKMIQSFQQLDNMTEQQKKMLKVHYGDKINSSNQFSISVSLEQYNNIIQVRKMLYTIGIIDYQSVYIDGRSANLIYKNTQSKQLRDIVDQLDFDQRMKVFNQISQIVQFCEGSSIQIPENITDNIIFESQRLYLRLNATQCKSNVEELSILYKFLLGDNLHVTNSAYDIQNQMKPGVFYGQNIYDIYQLAKNCRESNNFNYSIFIQENEKLLDLQSYLVELTNLVNIEIRNIMKLPNFLIQNKVVLGIKYKFHPVFYYLFVQPQNYIEELFVQKIFAEAGVKQVSLRSALEVSQYYVLNKYQQQLLFPLLGLNYYEDYSRFYKAQDQSIQKQIKQLPQIALGGILQIFGYQEMRVTRGQKTKLKFKEIEISFDDEEMCAELARIFWTSSE